MTRKFRTYEPDQQYLMPPSIREWVPAGDLSHFISDTVDSLNLSEFKKQYRTDGKGNMPYDPAMMLKVLIHGYSVGLFSSRKISQAMKRDVAFRMLGANNFPDFRTINRFRLENLDRFEKIFMEVVRLAGETGLIKLGTVAIDGSKIKANASKRKAMSYRRMKEEEDRLKQEIKQLIKNAQEADEEEDALYGEDANDDSLPEELQRREDRLKKIQEAQARLKERQKQEDTESGRKAGDHLKENRQGKSGAGYKREFGEPEDQKQDNFTDPESRIMKTSSEGFQQCYNAQIVVDQEKQIIVAADVGNNAADSEYFIPMVDQAEKNMNTKPENALADSGYKSESNFNEINKRKIRAYISLGREGKDAKKNINPKLKKAMKRRLEGTRGKKMYRKRKGIVEPPFGWIKHVLGFRRFSLRGLEKVKAEWSLVCLAMNLKRMNHSMQWA